MPIGRGHHYVFDGSLTVPRPVGRHPHLIEGLQTLSSMPLAMADIPLILCGTSLEHLSCALAALRLNSQPELNDIVKETIFLHQKLPMNLASLVCVT